MHVHKYLSSSVSWTWILLFIFMELNACLAQSMDWIQGKHLSNMVCPSLPHDRPIPGVRSVTECGTLCKTKGCVSFIFAPENKHCYLMKTTITTSSGCYPSAGAKYYFRITNEISCHPAFGSYQTTRLEDGDTFSFRVVLTHMTEQEARKDCQRAGGDLIKLSTLPRLRFIQKLMRKCSSEYLQSYYFIGGSNIMDSGVKTRDVWRWPDGELIPMNSTFWTPGHPNSPYYENCLLITNHMWLLDDHLCTAKQAYICGKES